MKISRLSPAAFDAAVCTTRMRSASVIAAAHDVLVEGKSQTEAARLHGFTHGRISAAVQIVTGAYLKLGRDSDTLVTLEIEVPEKLASALKEFTKSMPQEGDTARIERVISALRADDKCQTDEKKPREQARFQPMNHEPLQGSMDDEF